MTAKSNARKTPQKRKTPSQAEMRRQIAAEKQKNDVALQAVEKLAGIVGGLAQKIDQMASKESPADHDQSKLVVESVLREELDKSDFPGKPKDVVPDHLLRVKRELARNRPAIIRDTVDTGNEQVGEFEDRVINSEGDASNALDPIRAVDEGVVIDNKRYSQSKLEHEMFMHEYVCMKLFDTQDDTQEDIPEVGNGGIRQFFIRNKTQWVRRKFIEPLARAKKTRYTQVLDDRGNGDKHYRMVPHTALLHPFEVLEDTPKGKQWLRDILREAY